MNPTVDHYSLGNRSKPEDRGWVFQRGVQRRMERRVGCHQGLTGLKRPLPCLANFAIFIGTISHRPCRPFPPRSSYMANLEGQVSKFGAKPLDYSFFHAASEYFATFGCIEYFIQSSVVLCQPVHAKWQRRQLFTRPPWASQPPTDGNHARSGSPTCLLSRSLP